MSVFFSTHAFNKARHARGLGVAQQQKPSILQFPTYGDPDSTPSTANGGPPPSPLDVDDVERNALKRRSTFDEVVASHTLNLTVIAPPSQMGPLAGPRLRIPAATRSARQRLPRAATSPSHPRLPRVYVNPAVPLVADLDTSALPTTFGAYAAKAETKKEKHGGKVRRSLLDFVPARFSFLPPFSSC